MKIGITVNYLKLDKYIAIIERSGIKIDHIQLNGLPAEISEVCSDVIIKINELKSINPELTVSLHAYKFNFTEKVEKVRRIWLELAKDTLQFASEIQALFVNFHAGYGSGGTRIRHQSYREVLVPVFHELVDSASARGIEMHLENLFPRPIDSGIRMLADRPSDFEYFFNNIDNPSFKLCYDYGHGNIDEYGIEILRKFTHKLGSIHAHDNDQMSDNHWPIGCTGLGTIDWANELNFLRKINFEGPFIIESSLESQLKSLEYLIRFY